MEKNIIVDSLLELTPVERYSYEYYRKNHGFIPGDYMKDFISNQTYLDAFMIASQAEKNDSGLTAPNSGTFREPDFFLQGRDIAIWKQPRFSQGSPHSHDFFELIYLFKGSCRQIINNEAVDMPEGSICIIPPNTPHMPTGCDDSVIVNLLVRESTFHDSFFGLMTGDNVLSHFFTQALLKNQDIGYILFDVKRDRKIEAILFDLIDESQESEKYKNDLLDSLFHLLCVRMFQIEESRIRFPYRYDNKKYKINYILRYIESHYKDVSLKDTAKQFFYSSEYLSKFIKQHAGINFSSIVQATKLEKAKKALETTDLSVEEICDITGYANINYFIRNFKNHYQKTPYQYKKEFREKKLP